MKKRLTGIDIVIICIILLLIIITLAGLISYGTDKSFEITNQYGDKVKIFGNGIYVHDSYFKAPIFIGSDLTMLVVVVPMLAIALRGEIRKRTSKSKLFLTSVIATVLYYAFSMAFGVTYNSLHLIYIALLTCSLFALIALMKNTNIHELHKQQKWRLPSKGLSVFLVLSGVALFAAWLPDIIVSLMKGKSLAMIEVYTTEITNVLDIGVISPLMFICLYLLRKKDGLGDVVLAIILMACSVIGLMLPMQTLFQLMAGIVIPVPAFISKLGSFIVLAFFAVYFNRKLYKNLEE